MKWHKVSHIKIGNIDKMFTWRGSNNSLFSTACHNNDFDCRMTSHDVSYTFPCMCKKLKKCGGKNMIIDFNKFVRQAVELLCETDVCLLSMSSLFTL